MEYLSASLALCLGFMIGRFWRRRLIAEAYFRGKRNTEMRVAKGVEDEKPVKIGEHWYDVYDATPESELPQRSAPWIDDEQ